MTLEVLQQAHQWQLSGVLDARTAPVLWQKRSLLCHKDNTIDLAQLSKIDSAGLACLVTLMAEASQHQATLVWKNPPSALLQLAKVSDVDTLFTIDAEDRGAA